MKEKCYITSVITTHKDRRDEIIGPCGPCSFVNLVGLEGSFDLEKKLAEMGRLKPFHISNFTSFLIWAKYYGKDFRIVVSDTKIGDEIFDIIFDYEKIPDEKKGLIKKECLERYEKILEENKDRIIVSDKDYLSVIDESLDEGYKIAFLVIFNKESHWVVCYKKEGGKYFIKDSARGLLELNKEELEEALDRFEDRGFSWEVIGYKD